LSAYLKNEDVDAVDKLRKRTLTGSPCGIEGFVGNLRTLRACRSESSMRSLSGGLDRWENRSPSLIYFTNEPLAKVFIKTIYLSFHNKKSMYFFQPCCIFSSNITI
jgi:hypothetical protein